MTGDTAFLIGMCLFFAGLLFVGLQAILPNSMWNRYSWKKMCEEENRRHSRSPSNKSKEVSNGNKI